MNQIGISPKVAVPAVLGVLVGFGLVALGERDTGITVLLAALTQAGIGAAASPGVVDVNVGPASDQLLPDPNDPELQQ